VTHLDKAEVKYQATLLLSLPHLTTAMGRSILLKPQLITLPG